MTNREKDSEAKRLREILEGSAYSVTQGRTIRHQEQEHVLKSTLVLGLPDVLDFSKRKYHRVTLTDTMAPQKIAPLHSSMLPADERVRGSIMHGRLELRVVEGGSGSTGSDKNALFLELWESDAQVLRIMIPDCSDVHFGDNLGSPVFLDDGESIAFVGEKPEAKYPRGFWNENKENSNPSDKFKLRPDYGETMTKTKHPQVVLFNYKSLTWKTLELRGFDLAFPEPLLPDSILVTGFGRSSALHTPGLSRCFNRESSIFRVDGIWRESPTLTDLTSELYMCLAPKVSYNKSRVVFAGHSKYFSAHCTELDLFTVDLTSNITKRIEIEKVRDDESIVPSFNGVCLSNQAESGLITFLPNSDRLVVLSCFSSGRGGIFVIDIADGRVVASLFPPGVTCLSSVTLLDVTGSDVTFVHQGYTIPRSVWVASLAEPSNPKYFEVFSTPRRFHDKIPWFASASVSVIQSGHCPAFLLRSGNPAPRRPLIAYLHGGPHMMAVSSYSVEMVNFLAAGYDVVIPNYRGSLSYGKDFLDALVGHAGIVDVSDCHDCVMMAKRALNPSVTIAYGGSHGGFLTGWLLGHPEFNSEYDGGVLWNPAVDLVSSNLTSDIPEWALSQVLPSDQCMQTSPFTPPEEFFSKAYKQSPLSVVHNVRVPSLVLLGSCDKRVVPCGGLRWAQAVEASKKTSVEVLWFPEQGHAIAGPECYETAIVSIANWIANLVSKLT